MQPIEAHVLPADAVLEGGDLDCGSGLLLLIRRGIDPLLPGQLLDIRSTELSVDEDLPAWCRMTGNELVSFTRSGRERSFLVCKGPLAGREALRAERAVGASAPAVIEASGPLEEDAGPLPGPSPAPPIAALSVMGIGSWPRPRWLLQALHAWLEGRVSDEDFESTADDAVRLAIAAQLRAGVDVVTDGEQRRDSYASFVGKRLEGTQLVPLTDLLPMVDHPEALAESFASLDVPADKVRHPAVFARLRRTRPIAGHELAFAQGVTDRPVKVAIPGPYLLTRTMWMECWSDRAYPSRQALGADIARILRAEIFHLLAAGAAIVQLDEPVLTEVVHGRASGGRSFMCGALSEKGEIEQELTFARELLGAVLEGVPRERTALHMCRGNWTPDESAALTGDYAPLVETLASVNVGAYLLEACTPRAGDLEILRGLPEDRRIGVGVVNQKHARLETVDEIVARGHRAAEILGAHRVLLVPDCGFATFADNPVASAQAAEGKLKAMAEASARLRAELL